MGIKDDDLLPDERDMLAGKAPEPKAETPDDTPADAGAAAEDTPVVATADAAKTDETPATDETDETPPVEAATASADPARPTYDTPDGRDFKAERAALRTQEQEIEKKWGDGDLSDEERTAQLAEIRDRLDTVLSDQVRADTIADLNRQAIAQSQQQVLSAVSKASKDAGELDYTDANVAAAYDRMLGAVMADPDNSGKPFADLAKLAHDGLCAVRGVKRAAPAAPAPATNTPAAPAPRNIPTTLSSMPSAAAVPVSNDVMTSLGALDDPDAAEALIGALTAAQKTALLRSTIPAGGGRHR